MKTRFRKGLKQWIEVAPFLVIPLVLFCAFVLYPHIKNLYIAVTNYSILPGKPSPFVGLDNFARLFTKIGKKGSDAYYFWIAFRNNILAVLITVPGQMILGLLVAVLLNSIKRGQTVIKIILYIAVICDWVVFTNIINYIFQADSGSMMNYLLLKLGIIKKSVAWLSNTWTGNFVVWFASIWKGFGWVMIIYLAALAGVSKDYYEAATIDGANSFQKFWHITIPCIMGTTFYLLVNLIIGAMNIFTQVFLLTKGSPMGTTDVVMNYIYTRAFSFMEFSYAAACSLVMGLFIFICTFGLKRYMRYGTSTI